MLKFKSSSVFTTDYLASSKHINTNKRWIHSIMWLSEYVCVCIFCHDLNTMVFFLYSVEHQSDLNQQTCENEQYFKIKIFVKFYYLDRTICSPRFFGVLILSVFCFSCHFVVVLMSMKLNHFNAIFIFLLNQMPVEFDENERHRERKREWKRGN